MDKLPFCILAAIKNATAKQNLSYDYVKVLRLFDVMNLSLLGFYFK